MSGLFCVKWNNHMSNMMDVCKQFLSTEEMADVTLACEGRRLKAHKFILSASSTFFRLLLTENPCKHPIVILNNVKYLELKALMEFMYYGEMNISKHQLPALMKVAETLGIKGLTQPTDGTDFPGNEIDTSSQTVRRPSKYTNQAGTGRRKRLLSTSSHPEGLDLKTKRPQSIGKLPGEVNAHRSQHSPISPPVLQGRDTNSQPSELISSLSCVKGSSDARNVNSANICSAPSTVSTRSPISDNSSSFLSQSISEEIEFLREITVSHKHKERSKLKLLVCRNCSYSTTNVDHFRHHIVTRNINRRKFDEEVNVTAHDQTHAVDT